MSDKLLWDSKDHPNQRVEAAWYGFFGFELPDRPSSVEPIENGKGSILVFRIDGSRTMRLKVLGDSIQLFERSSSGSDGAHPIIIGDAARHHLSWPPK